MTAPAPPAAAVDPERVVAATRRWIERAVIGLNLCPYARPAFRDELIRYVVSHAPAPEALADDLARELQALAEGNPAAVETTLLIHPGVLTDFLEFNDFLDVADALVADLGLSGVIQVASFHPDYRFAGSSPEDIENCTNRSPYPTLHLLREASVERAAASLADPAQIYERNIETLRRLGHEGWRRLWADTVARSGDGD